MWFRRDLRLTDNSALYHALAAGLPVLPIFIFDTNILEELDENDKRVQFIHTALLEIQEKLISISSSLKIMRGSPLECIKNLSKEYAIQNMFANHDYEPYAILRDNEISNYLSLNSIQFITFKDQVIFEKYEIVKEDNTPYTVFTPYAKKWKASLNNEILSSYSTEKLFMNFMKVESVFHFPSLEELGFEFSDFAYPGNQFFAEMIQNYHETRDIPSLNGTSQLSIHLRFGTISIRELVRKGLESNEKFLNELIWRDFYQMILWHFPQVVNSSFKSKYDRIPWLNEEDKFKAWCDGQTGYPIVDAGMRQLNETGWMHNRVRMIVASFLTKHLLIDWRWGESYFAKKLLDYDAASNIGGWQWAAGCGVDAAPYFRIFNPYLQTLKFDPKLLYIRRWVPEFENFDYPKPIVNHEEARQRCLACFKKAIQ
jgi:deoxyribodipyrimidine photo-lyase